MRHRGLGAFLVVASAMVVLPTRAWAVPIVYETLLNGVPVAGVNGQVADSFDQPDGATYYRFQATSASSVTVTGSRVDGFYDMSFWIFEGLFADTDDFGPVFSFLDAIDIGDDELPPAVAGPYGDPQVTFLAPTSGWYTVAVTNFLSEPGGPPNRFTLVVDGLDTGAPVPEPGTMLLLGAGLSGIALKRRRR